MPPGPTRSHSALPAHPLSHAHTRHYRRTHSLAHMLRLRQRLHLCPHTLALGTTGARTLARTCSDSETACTCALTRSHSALLAHPLSHARTQHYRRTCSDSETACTCALTRSHSALISHWTDTKFIRKLINYLTSSSKLAQEHLRLLATVLALVLGEVIHDIDTPLLGPAVLVHRHHIA